MCSERAMPSAARSHNAADTSVADSLIAPERRRLKIWQMRANVQCSVVGTCLSEGDLKKVLARCGLHYNPSMPSYDLHGYFATAICKDCPVARMVQKILDRRHEGILRRVGRAPSTEELSALWIEEFAAGRIPGAYWAFLTHAHVTNELHARVFGEVHMLSHLLGQTAKVTASKVSELQAALADTEARMSRMRARHQQSLEERDRVIESLQKRLQDLTSRSTPKTSIGDSSPRRQRREQRLGQRRERAICVARQRARSAEAAVVRLQALLTSTLRAERTLRRSAPDIGDGEPSAAIDNRQPGKPMRVLYVGGRTGGVDRLREIASGSCAELIHHDGGIEEAVANLDRLLERCQAVFCPVDCVSHSACLRAKQLCRKHGKIFVPLRSSGGASFKRALKLLSDETGA
jgi:two-component sensor histidine kinase